MTEAPPAGTGAIEIADNPRRHRYEIHVGSDLAGFVTYHDLAATDGGVPRRVFPHTEVKPEYGGRGLATTVIAFALDAERARRSKITPSCPFVASFIAKNPGYSDLVADGGDLA